MKTFLRKYLSIYEVEIGDLYLFTAEHGGRTWQICGICTKKFLDGNDEPWPYIEVFTKGKITEIFDKDIYSIEKIS